MGKKKIPFNCASCHKKGMGVISKGILPKYCTRQCSYEGKKKYWTDKKCLYCNIDFNEKKRKRNTSFCSLRCSTSFRYKSLQKKVSCVRCKTVFEIRGTKQQKRMFCSTKCVMPKTSLMKLNGTKEQKLSLLKQQYEKYVQRNDNGCWDWNAQISNRGYAMITWLGRKISAAKAHYLIANGYDSIPEKMFVCHTCDNRICSRLDHLFLGTAKDNIHDMIKKGRRKITSKLTLKEIEQIKALSKEGLSQEKIGKIFNISQTHAGSIIRGESGNLIKE